MAILGRFEDQNLYNNLLNDYEIVPKGCIDKKRNKINKKKDKINHQRNDIKELCKVINQRDVKIVKEGEKLKTLRKKTKNLRANLKKKDAEIERLKKSNQTKTYMLHVAFGVMGCAAGLLYLTQKPFDPNLEFTYVSEEAFSDANLQENTVETLGWIARCTFFG